MSPTAPGRHRAPRQPLSARATRLFPPAPIVRGSAVAAATGGLILSFPAGASSAPAAGVTQLPAAPAPVVAPVLTPAAVPTVTPSLPARPAISGTLRLGSRGESVRVIQRIVGTVPDGVFGPKTHAAVKRYQARKGLVVDGIVGPKTARAMGLAFGTAASRSTSTASRSASRTSTSTSGVLAVAAKYTGIMYRYGGTSPSTGFDCSGFTQFVFGKVGVKLPRTADAQRRATTRVSSPRPGDLVFFGSPAYHVGIYAGNGMMYDSGRSGLPTQKRKVFSGVSGYGRVG
ncbi:cell wall lytic activity [Nostocoides sp. F2B08]|uniref:C40 family peptidase n=1 Tax=Nostocoides sp. F2B08 TaxID=2653936 RepID=UPI0012631549|nr:NlpC/P60 family protein [Tetrasphaera sp. F2B08]KAB7743865.1 cell wall lytic activity [Tetrasphaera sp. F2B08]